MVTLSGGTRRASLFVSALAATLLCAPVTAAAADGPAPLVRYADVLRSFNPHLGRAQSQDMATHVLLVCSYYGLDPRLLIAIVGVESSWHPGAVSRVGAQGLGQLMPSTAGGLDVLAFDAYENLDGTARYLRRMLQQNPALPTEARTARAVASYNAGPLAVARAGGVPPFAETRAYVARVLDLWHRLEAELPANVTLPTEGVRPPPRAVAHAALASRAAPRPTGPAGSVADFLQLEVRSMERLAADAPAATPVPVTPAPRGVRRWLARAFGAR